MRIPMFSVIFALMVVITAAAADQAASSTLDLGAGVRLQLVDIPSGQFTSGESDMSRSNIGFFSPHEIIARSVQISKPFYTGKYLVTVGEFTRFAQAANYVTDAESGSRPWRDLTKGCYTVTGKSWGAVADASWKKPGFAQDETHPVTCISWNDAKAFCDWLSKQTGKKVRLPTEAELEYLQRASMETAYYWGNRTDYRSRWANLADGDIVGDDDLFPDGQPSMKRFTMEKRNDGYKYTTPVGFFPPNMFGVYDAIGNVWEYTEDWEGDDPARVDPHGASSERYRSMKGGSWLSTPDFYRPSIRLQIEPESRTSTRGFRVVVEQ
jgi:sulfatase modifying factor 1